jgi:hypothetical protein
VVLLSLVVLAELGVRIRASSMPDPLRWSAPELQYKEQQIHRLQSRGGASIVFLGSSVVDVGVDPTLVAPRRGGRPAYNAATGGGSIAMIDTWAERVAVPRLKPDVVVIGLVSRELNPNDPVQTRLERSFVASAAVRQLDGTETLAQRAERYADRLSALLKYRTLLRQGRFLANIVGTGNAPSRRTRSTTTADDGQYQGFLSLRYNGGSAAQFRATALRDYRVGPRQLATLRSLLAYAKAHVAHVIVVDMPVTATYVSLHPRRRTDQDAFDSALATEAAAVGAPLVRAGVWPEDAFADPAHLNGVGAHRLTAMLIEQLRASVPEVLGTQSR